MWTYMMAAARGDRAMSSISQRHQSSRNDFDSPSIYHFNRVQRPLYNTTHRAPALCNGPSTISTTPFGSNTIYQNFNPSTVGSFSSVATTPSLSTTTTPAPVGTGQHHGSGGGGSAPTAASTPTQQPAFTTRNRIEVASEQGSMPNSNNSKNNHLSQAVIECERNDFLLRCRWCTMCFEIRCGVLLIVIIGVLVQLARSSISTHDDRIPFVVSLENEGGQFCSGTIVTNNWILTAASCVWNKLSTEVSIGIQPPNAESSGYHQRAHKIYVHPDFSRHSSGNDVALIKLKRAIEWNGHTVMMRLVNDSGYVRDMSGCLMTGWDRNRIPSIQAELVQLLARDKCVGEHLHGLCVNITDDRFCKFHGGSPVFCLREDRYAQIAFLSDRKHCDLGGSLDVFTSVVHFHEWIMGVVRHNAPIVVSKGESRYLTRLSRFNWLILAVLIFISSVVILIKVLRSRFRVV